MLAPEEERRHADGETGGKAPEAGRAIVAQAAGHFGGTRHGLPIALYVSSEKASLRFALRRMLFASSQQRFAPRTYAASCALAPLL